MVPPPALGLGLQVELILLDVDVVAGRPDREAHVRTLLLAPELVAEDLRTRGRGASSRALPVERAHKPRVQSLGRAEASARTKS